MRRPFHKFHGESRVSEPIIPHLAYEVIVNQTQLSAFALKKNVMRICPVAIGVASITSDP
jgi:hypothetical protein